MVSVLGYCLIRRSINAGLLGLLKLNNQRSMSSTQNRNMNDNCLVWVDLEMTACVYREDVLAEACDPQLFRKLFPDYAAYFTPILNSLLGLDIEKDKIMEMACLITDSDLNLIAEGPDILIHQPDSVLGVMGEWCRKHHGKSGLTKAVRESNITVEMAEEMVLKFVEQYTTPKKCLLAGNSVHVDKKFLDKYMPKFMNHLHYRIIDVSTIKELCRYWYPQTLEKMPKKTRSHRALDDIKESLQELKCYKSSIFR